MGFSRQEYLSELPFPPPGIKPGSAALAGRFFYHLNHQGSPAPGEPGAETRVENSGNRISQVVQWLGLRAPNAGAWVRSLVQELGTMRQVKILNATSKTWHSQISE